VKYNSTKSNQLAKKVPGSNSTNGKPKPGGHGGKGRGTAAIINGVVDALGGLDSGDSGADDGGSGGTVGDQQVSDSESEPQVTTDAAMASYQPESPDSTTSEMQPVPNALPNFASSGAVKVINPSETGQTVNYTLGSESGSLEAGTANIHSQVSQQIVFDRGGPSASPVTR
jgi:hypothetical protein